MNKKKIGVIGTSFVAGTMMLAGCGILPSNKQASEPKPNAVTTTQKETTTTSAEGQKEQQVQGVKTQLYLIDRNGYVVPETMSLPNTQSITKQALQYLVADGPVDSMLPNGFRAPLPAGTTVLGVDVSSDGKVATVDFSKEFLGYQKEDEQRVMEAVTWTVTQFKKVATVQIKVNGKVLTEMPQSKVVIGDGLSRNDGINIDTSSVVDVTNTSPVTVYYVAQNGKETYYVPITKRVSNNEKDISKAVVEELIKGPSVNTNLSTDFNVDAKLLENPIYENGKVTLNFNDNILNNGIKNTISDYVLNALVLSLTEQPGIESVSIEVNGKNNILNEEGQTLAKPVTRPGNVNTGSF